MKYDVILAGVGGQGVLSLANVIALAAQNEGLFVRQSEVHGMAQRGGSVLAHLRLADSPVPGDLIPQGRADLILSLEPLESLRYLKYLKPEGALVSSLEPVKNIQAYPAAELLEQALQAVKPSRLLNTAVLAKEAGHAKSANLVLVGGASEFLPLKDESYMEAISFIFGRKGEAVVELNRRAFSLGKAAAQKEAAL